MTEKKSLFRVVFDALAEGRSRQAQRYIESYRTSHDLAVGLKSNVDQAFTRRQG